MTFLVRLLYAHAIGTLYLIRVQLLRSRRQEHYYSSDILTRIVKLTVETNTLTCTRG